MDSRSPRPYLTMPTVATYLNSQQGPSNTGHNYGSPPNQLDYSFSLPLQTMHPVPSNLPPLSFSERALAKERRKEQNRASQRAYRKRKDSAVKDLHDSIKDLQKGAENLKAENGNLKGRNDELQIELEKLLAENRQLKRRRSPSQHPMSKSSTSRQQSGCMQCLDQKDSLTLQHCTKHNTSCTSPASPLNSSLSLGSPSNSRQDLQAEADIDMDPGLRTFWMDLDEDIQIDPQGASLGFFDNLQSFVLDRPPNSTMSEYLVTTAAQSFSGILQPRSPFNEEMSSSQFGSYLRQNGSDRPIPIQAGFDAAGVVDMDSTLGRNGELSNAIEKRRKTVQRPQLL